MSNPAIISSYRSRATLPGLWKQFFDYGRWKVRVLSAHPRQAKLRHLVPVTLVLALLTGIIASLWLPVARVGTDSASWRGAVYVATPEDEEAHGTGPT